MRVHHLRFAVALVFLAVGLVLLFRNQLAADFFARFPEGNLELGTWLALVLAGWHAARGYMDYLNWRSRTSPRENPLRPRYDENPSYEKNPELDFFQQGPAAGEGGQPPRHENG